MKTMSNLLLTLTIVTAAAIISQGDGPRPGGSLDLLHAAPDKLHVGWEAPEFPQGEISYYMVGIAELVAGRNYTPHVSNASRDRNYEFSDLKPLQSYIVTVEGLAFSQGDRPLLWHISKIFQTLPSVGDGILSWLAEPTNLILLEKTGTSLYFKWDPPENLLPSYQDLVTHYVVTYAPLDRTNSRTGTPQQVIARRPGRLRVWLRGLEHETVYNITVQAGTDQGYGEILWGAYSTLHPGQPYVVDLMNRTPTSLQVYWTRVWGSLVDMYRLTVEPLYSADPFADLNKILAFNVSGTAEQYVIKGLNPQTIYNVTLKPMTADTVGWAAYATLPPGAFVVTNLKVCDETSYSRSFSWTPIDDANPRLYQVRYAKQTSSSWSELPQRSKHEMRCPGDPCDVLCFAIYNLAGGAQQYIVQVRAFVDGSWNRWKTVAGLLHEDSIPSWSHRQKQTCCIVPPPDLGDNGSQKIFKIKPVPNATFVQRYYVIVDEREPHGEVNETTLYDKVTAKRYGLPYYITASFDKYTLTVERMFPIGDGEIYGGYINYPLQRGSRYNFVYPINWAFSTIWMLERKPPAGYLSGLKCYYCVNCKYPDTGTEVQCSAGEVCVHLKTALNRIPPITTRGCFQVPLNFLNTCQEHAVDGAVTKACFCNTDLCNGEENSNNALTRAAGEGRKPGFNCYSCRHCNYPNTGTPVQCSAGEACFHLQTTNFNGIPQISRKSCTKQEFNYVNSCHEHALNGGVARVCYCNSDLCNDEEYPNNGLTRAADERTKPGLKCYGCARGDCNDRTLREMQCSKGFDSCSTLVIEHEVFGLSVVSKACSSGMETGCVTSGAKSLCVCKGNLCNGYGTTVVDLQLQPVGNGTSLMNVVNREVEEKQFNRPNDNINNLSATCGVILMLLVVLCIVCTIGGCFGCGCAIYRKFIRKGSASSSNPVITYTSLQELKAYS